MNRWGVVVGVGLLSLGVLGLAWGNESRCYPGGCVDTVKKVTDVEWVWFLKNLDEPAKNQIRKIVREEVQAGVAECAADCAAACSESIPDCPACPGAVECTNASCECPPFDDQAVGLYAMAWYCNGLSKKLAYVPTSGGGFSMRCRKKVRNPVPLDFIGAQRFLEALGH